MFVHYSFNHRLFVFWLVYLRKLKYVFLKQYQDMQTGIYFQYFVKCFYISMLINPYDTGNSSLHLQLNEYVSNTYVYTKNIL